MTLDARALELVDQLTEELPMLVDRIVDRVVADDSAFYENIAVEELRVVIEGSSRLAIQALREQRRPSEQELELVAAIGQMRAQQGRPLERVLRTIREGAREAVATLEDLAVGREVDVATTLGMVRTLWDWLEDVSAALSTAHRDVELAMTRQEEQERTAFVHGLVSGTLSTQRLSAGAAAYGLDLEGLHHAVRLRATAAHSAESLSRLIHPTRWSPGIVSMVEADLALVTPKLPEVELPVAAGVGPAVPLTMVSQSFLLASRALDTAIAFGRTGFQRLEDLSLRAGVVAEESLGEMLDARYLAPVRAMGAFGEELLHSLRTYFEHDQAVDPAAKALFVHPNTLRHRLARFEEATGANLRNVEHLAEIWWALARDELSP